MSRRHEFCPLRVCNLDQLSPLEGAVAQDAGVGGFIRQVAGDKGFNHFLPKRILYVLDLPWDTQLSGDLPRTLQSFLFLSISMPHTEG